MLYIDIETDGLNPSQIWLCGVAEDDKPPFPVFSATELQRLVDRADAVVAHNGIKFDYPVLRRLWGINFDNTRLIDSYVLSSLASPSRDGGHGLGAWGATLGYEKGDHSDWSKLSDEMIQYCLRDVSVMRKAVKVITKELSAFSNGCADLEHKVAEIMYRQELTGFKLDVPKAEELYAHCCRVMNEVESSLQAQFKPIVEERWSEKTGKQLKTKITPFNIGSRKQIGERLMSIGWKPKQFTDGGQPKVDETVLSKLPYPEAQDIAKYLLHQKRAAQVSSWLEAADKHGRVHGRVRTIGAVTGRMTHSGPNMAQIPAVRAELGHECREVWTVDKGNKLVGIDASGLELRMLAHYMQDPEYTKAVCEGTQEDGTDVHSRNMRLAGLDNRDQAKTFIYAFLYGAGDGKIGQIVNGTAADGAALRERFLKGLPALNRLITTVQKIADEKGSLPSLDGRRIGVRHQHAALNTLLQGAGAVVMKEWLVVFDNHLRIGKYPAKFVANVHDEVQIEVNETFAEDVAKIGVDCFDIVTANLSLRCPLAGDYKIGNNWAETH